MEIKKIWSKFFKRKKTKAWKTDVLFGIVGNESLRGHMCLSGANIIDGRLVGGEIYYLRDICGNVLINRDEYGKNLLQ